MTPRATRVRIETREKARATYQWLRGRPLSCRLRGDGAVAQFARFVLVGGASNLVYTPIFLLLRFEGAVLANVIGTVVSTVMASELHRQLTFNAADRVRWQTAQWEAGGLALVGLIASSLALMGAQLWFPHLVGLWQVALVMAVSGIIGGLRFLALRGWVFKMPAALQNV